MLFHYVKENIIQMLKKEKFLFLLIFFVQAASVVIILFSYGIFNHYNTKVDEVEGTSLDYGFQTAMNEYVDASSVQSFYKEVLPKLEMKLKSFYIISDINHEYYKQIHCTSGYYKGNFTTTEYIENEFIPTSLMEGRFFTDKELNSNEKVCYIPVTSLNEETPKEVILDGETYKTVGRFVHGPGSVRRMLLVPLYALPQNVQIIHFSLSLNIPLTKTEHEFVCEVVEKYFGNAIPLPEFTGINNESNNRVYRSLVFVSVFLTAISVVNYCLIYRYILAKRKKSLAISRICGCKMYQALAIYLTELLSVSLAILAVFELVYVKLILPILQFKFEYMIYYYNKDFYIKFNVMYIAALLVAYSILVIGMVRKTPNQLVKEV